MEPAKPDRLGAVARGAARAGPRRGDTAGSARDGRDRAGRPTRARGGPAQVAAPGAHARRSRRAHIERLGARFDGRLRISAVDRANGRRVIFGAPDAPRATVAQAVLASCAVPWLFAPVEIGEREYVDGGVWSPTNLDAVPAGRGSRILCLIPTAGRHAGLAANGDRRRRGLRVDGAARPRRGDPRRSSRIEPSLDAIGPNLMDPSRRGAVAAAGYAQGRRLAA